MERDGLLWNKDRLVLPPNSPHKEAVIHEFHNTPMGGHSGMFRTYKRIASNFYWVGMKKDIQDYIWCCDICQRNKSDTLTPIQGRSHIVAWGGRGPYKFFFFPLAYEEQIIRPSQHFTTGPPTHFSQILPALNQKLETPSIFF